MFTTDATPTAKYALLVRTIALLSVPVSPCSARDALRRGVLLYCGPWWLLNELHEALHRLAQTEGGDDCGGRGELILAAVSSLCCDAALAPALEGGIMDVFEALSTPSPAWAVNQGTLWKAYALTGLCALLEHSHTVLEPLLFTPKLLSTLASIALDPLSPTLRKCQALRALRSALQRKGTFGREAGTIMESIAHLCTTCTVSEVCALGVDVLAQWVRGHQVEGPKGCTPPSWTPSLHRLIVGQLAGLEGGWVGLNTHTSMPLEPTAPLGAGRAGEERAVKAGALALCLACFDSWGGGWLYPPSVSGGGGGGGGGVSPTSALPPQSATQPSPLPKGAQLLLLLSRLVAVELKDCVDTIGDLLVLPESVGGVREGDVEGLLERMRKVNPDFSGKNGSYVDTPSGGDNGGEQGGANDGDGEEGEGEEGGEGEPHVIKVAEAIGTAYTGRVGVGLPAPPLPPPPPPPAASSALPAKRVSAPPPTRAQRNSRLRAIYPPLLFHFTAGCALYTRLVRALVHEVGRSGDENSGGSGGGGVSESPSHSLTLSIRDTLYETSLLLLSLPSDAWNGQLHLDFMALGGGEAAPVVGLEGRGVGGGDGNASMDLEESIACREWRVGVLSPLCCIASASACAYFEEDEEGGEAELVDALPLMLKLPYSHSRVKVGGASGGRGGGGMAAAAAAAAAGNDIPTPPHPTSTICIEAVFGGPEGALHYPLAPLIPVIAARMHRSSFLTPLTSLNALHTLCAWLRTVCRGLALDVMVLEGRGEGGIRNDPPPSPPATLNPRTLSLACVALKVVCGLAAKGGRKTVVDPTLLGSLAEDLLATARKCASEKWGRVVAGVGDKGLVALALLAAFSRHAVVACIAVGEMGGEGLMDAAFECFKGVGVLTTSAGGEHQQHSASTPPPTLPYQELMFTDDDMLDAIGGLMAATQ